MSRSTEEKRDIHHAGGHHCGAGSERLLPQLGVGKKPPRLLMDREHDAPSLAHHTVPRAGWVDEKRSRGSDAILVLLRPRQHDDVLIPRMHMQRHLAGLPKTDERGSR